MSPLRRSPPDPARPTLRQRLAALKAGIARPKVQTAAPAPEPLPLPELGVEGAPPASHADAALIRLGREFEAAQARAAIFWRDWNDRADAAGAAHPIRPAILTFRAEDAAFCLRKLHRTPDAIDGTAVMADDIAWMRRRPLTHQVVRDARPGEHGWRDFGGRVPEIVPWPEAQARADELITAWDGWRADVQRVRDEHGVDAAEDRNDEAEAVVLSLCDRIAALPASTAEGLRIKLRASAHYEEDHDSAYPGGRLLNSLLADAKREGAPAPGPTPERDWPAFAALHPGMVPYPAHAPTILLALDLAIQGEAGRLLDLAEAEIGRRRQAYAGFHDPTLWPRVELSLRREMRVEALIAAAADLSDDDSGADPVLTAIAASYRAEAEMKAFGDEATGPMTPEQSAREDVLGDAQYQARIAVWDTPPTTHAGRLALVEYAYFQVSLYGAVLAPGTDHGVVVHEILKAFKAAASAERREIPADSRLSPDRAWAVAQADAVDLYGLTILHLHNLFSRFSDVADRWLDLSCARWAQNSSDGPFSDPDAAGRIIDRECERANEIRARIAAEMGRRPVPTDRFDRDWQMETLIVWELACNTDLRHAPELRARIAAEWSR